MKILIAGATGLVGSEIMKLALEKEHQIYFLTTNKSKIENITGAKGFYWNPSNKEVDNDCLEGVNCIINLAGAVISKRWTKYYRKKILESRIESLELLYELLSENDHEVKHIVTASAIGIYPSSYFKQYKESDTFQVNSFLGRVVEIWEEETDKFKALELKVSKMRIGIVLAKNRGALGKIIKPIKNNFGAPLGSGKQYMSWIHIRDLARMFLFVLEQELEGTYNAVASQPINNSKMTKAIAMKLNKPLWLPNIPAFMIKSMLGQMANLVLSSQYVDNTKILNKGFEFKFNTVEEALEDLLT